MVLSVGAYVTNIKHEISIYDTVTLKCVKSRVPWYHSNLHFFSIYNNNGHYTTSVFLTHGWEYGFECVI